MDLDADGRARVRRAVSDEVEDLGAHDSRS
jgi:hypothetical protein